MTILDIFARAYRKTGIHAAPPGTMLHTLNGFINSLIRRHSRSYAIDGLSARGRFGGVQYYNIARLRRTRPISGLALIFFIGAGDYLMATPLIEALHEEHPDLTIWAYVSSNADSVNSPLVRDLLKINPFVSKVIPYQGRPRAVWTEYNFSDALRDIPDDFAILPVIYDTDPSVLHRGTSLLETFGLRVDMPIKMPIAYPAPLTKPISEMLEAVKERLKNSAMKGLVFTHFGARSSGYDYPHVARLAWLLSRRGYFVASFTRTGLESESVLDLDISKFSILDSIELIRHAKVAIGNISIISVNSVMWPISAALGIPNLGMHAFWDPAVHQYHYPNIFVVTPHLYSNISPCRLFLASPADYQERLAAFGAIKFTDYRPEYIAECADRMLSQLQ